MRSKMNVVIALASLIGCGGVPEECAPEDRITVYADNDKDGYGSPDTPKDVCPPVDENGVPTGQIPRGFAANDDDCDDLRAEVNPDQIEICDGVDNDCDTQADEGLRQILFFVDADGDGYGDPDVDKGVSSCAPPAGYVADNTDCDDENNATHPTAVEVCDGGIDNDCDGRADDLDFELDKSSAPTYYLDSDGDSYGDPAQTRVQCLSPGVGWVENGDDCLDSNPAISPSATEVCNHIDDDCDQHIDDSDSDIDPTSQTTWFADADNDGYGDPASSVQACFQPWFHVLNSDDCDDTEPLLGLPAPWVEDRDGDGFGAGRPSADACTPPQADYVLLAVGLDCDDTNPFTNPFGDEVCDGDDNDCDTLIDDADDSLDPNFATEYHRDADRDTFGDPDLVIVRCAQPPGFVTDDTDCNDAVATTYPGAAETCDGADDDCDGLVDDGDPDLDPLTTSTWYFDGDHDGFGSPDVTTQACQQPNLYVDNQLDCDDGDPAQLANLPWLRDRDGDGVGSAPSLPASCTQPQPGYVSSYYGLDCDDADDARFPGNTEICNNGIDEDCDGSDAACFRSEPAFTVDESDAILLVDPDQLPTVDPGDAVLRPQGLDGR